MTIHDILGFSDDVQRIARRFAAAGYAALAPALYDGAGAPPLCVVRTLRDHARGRGAAFDRLDAARAWLSARDDIDGRRIGVAGFCMGGGFALYWAARGGFRVCAPFYGQVPRRTEQLARLCPTVASFGERDAMFRSDARRLEEHLATLGIPHDVRVYPGVGHSFMNDHGSSALMELGRHTPMRAAYDEATAEVAWARMLAFFGDHL